MNQAMWSDLFGLYDKSSNKTGFRRDRDALIEKGFIACMEDGSPTRTKSVYCFSSMWQKYGKEGFRVRDCDKTASMLKKANKKGGMKRPTPTSSGTQEMTFVPESERKVQCGKN